MPDHLNNSDERVPTVGGTISAGLVRGMEGRKRFVPFPITPVNREGSIPLSLAQRRLWFLDQMDGMDGKYHIPLALSLQGSLDQSALGRALDQVLVRHEALRTRFPLVDGEPVQQISAANESSCHLVEHDLRGHKYAQKELDQLIAEEFRAKFDVKTGPHIRGKLIQQDEDKYVLLLTVHHIVFDGWSLGILRDELSDLYNSYVRGEADPLSPLKVQYADYAVWHRKWMEGELLQKQAEYWKVTLAGTPPLLELPTDYERPAQQDYSGRLEQVMLDEKLTAGLKSLSKKHRTTLYMTLLTGWAALLTRLSGQQDIVIGTPVVNRSRVEIERVIGFFVNTVALRLNIANLLTVKELLGQVKAQTLAAQQHQDLPFERVVELVRPLRSSSHSALFQVMFVWNSAPEGSIQLSGLEVQPLRSLHHATAHFDLTLSLQQQGGTIVGSLEYATSLFEATTIKRYVEYFRNLLEDMVADDLQQVNRLSMLSEIERNRTLYKWNKTEAAFAGNKCVHEMFEMQAYKTAEAIAVVFKDESLSYGELNSRANQLAYYLTKRGVKPDDRVAIWGERGSEIIVALLAVLKAGGAYLPLDPLYPANRLQYMIADAGANIVIASASLPEDLSAEISAYVLNTREAALDLAACPVDTPVCRVTPENLAYVIYTSGSTGQPKGVQVAHRGVVNLACAQAREFGIGQDSRVLQFASLSFDAAVSEIFTTLVTGATLVMAPAEALLPGPALTETLRHERITVVTLPPAVLAVQAPAGLPALRTVVSAGEALSATVLALWAGGGRTLINAYGPTEITVCASQGVCTPDGQAPGLGQALANVQLYVVDAAGAPVPIGVPGELYVGGAGLARGYLGRPGMTAAAFVPDPFGPAGGRLYRTGDRVRRRADGTLEFLGRRDRQIKLRGFRIEVAEVERTLMAQPAVRAAAVVVREDAPGDRRLVAYAVSEADGSELREQLRRSLPEYMVPSVVVVLDRLPLTPNGKIDVAALPPPDMTTPTAKFVAPRTPLEEALAAIWVDALQVARVGATDDFFDLGGHSLLATRLVARVRDVLGVELPVGTLFERPTVAALAAWVEEVRRVAAPALAAIPVAPRNRPLPLSFSQQRLWFLDQMQPGSTLYNMPVTRCFHGVLDVRALERALGEIVRRHEVLRTTFAEVEGAPAQIIAPFAGFTLTIEDLSSLPAAERDPEARRRTQEEAARPFDLAAGPLLRASLLKLADDNHTLLLCAHHITSDGWSMSLLFHELSTLYAAYRDGRESPLLPLSLQYADYAVWQREQMQSESFAQQLAWWKVQLADAPELLSLPTDHPRPPIQTFRGAFEPLHIPVALLERLQFLSRREGATLFMVLLGALTILLSRYTGSEDVLVGSPIAGRTRHEIEDLLGCFVNVLLLRTDLSGNPDFRDIVQRVRGTTLGAFNHQDVPFERIVDTLQPVRSLSYSPLFQVSFTLNDAGETLSNLPELALETFEIGIDASKTDLSVILAVNSRGLEGGLIYNTDLFERQTMVRMVRHLLRVLEQIVIDPEVHLAELSLLDETERLEVVEVWNRTEAAYSADRCIHELIEQQVTQTPQAVAVSGGEQLSYEELDRRANQVAHYLMGLGVGPETRVGVCLGRGVRQVVAVLGVLKAGGAYVPLDPAYPAERLAFLIGDAGVAVLLTEERLLEVVPVTEGVLVSLDGLAALDLAACPVDTPVCRVTPENLAYVIYTSGSTGQPKGVQVAHRGVVNLACAQAREFGIGQDSRVLQFASLSFDAAVSEIFTTLVTGATLVMAPAEALLPGPALTETLRHERITVVTLPPAVLAVQAPAGLPALRTVVSAGEALSATVLALWAGGGRTLINAYGPTEITVCASQGVCTPDGQAPGLGQALANVQLYVVDAAGAPVPIGVPGELYVGGAGLARGYLGRPGMTAAAFVPDPFGPAGGRLYRTGDRVRRRADGTLEFLGRRDRQIKLRGFRIEVAEVERTLMAQPAVRAAAVVVREDAPGDRRLVAYAVSEADGSELREQLRRSLPEYMVPSVVVVLDRLPLTPNGKIDVAALPPPDMTTPTAKFVAPRTPLEEALAAIWVDALQVARVGATDDFFDLGGHSLLATRLVARVRDVLGVELPVGTLFERPTVAALAAWVEEVRRVAAPALAAIPVAPRNRPLPLSFSQQRLWFLDQMQPGSTLYNMPVTRCFHGVLDVRALERALGEIVRRHEVLRTTFAEVEGAPAQIIAPFAGFTLTIEDLSSLPAAERDPEARRRTQEEAARPFDLAAGPLLRASLLKLADDNHTLLLCAHHITSDGWSMSLLFHELSTLYAAYRDGRESPLLPLSLQYADYAVWQREQMQSESFAQQLAWWKVQLADAPELLSLPTDHPRPPIQTDKGAVEVIGLPSNLVERLEALGREEGATLYMILLCAWQMVLCLHSGTDDLTIGTTIAGRTRQEIEPLIGLFMSTLVLRTDLSGDPSFKQMLQRTRTVTLGAFDHQDVPFERIVAEISPDRSLSYAPLFQVLFELQDTKATSDYLAGLEVTDLPLDLEIAKFDLSISLVKTASGLMGGLIFRTELFERLTIRCIAEHFVRVLEHVAANSQVRLSELALLEGTELESVVQQWNQTAAAYPADRCIHELFEAQVARTPDDTAVTYGETSLTYRELDTYANCLARELRRLSVGPESRVGVYLERNLELMVAILGVLKAGGAYVPIDPAYPVERVSYILTDSGVKVLLTQQSLRTVLASQDAVEVLYMDQKLKQVAPEIEENVAHGATAENLAYVIYTSGSTGQPKGVAMHHRGVCNYIDWAIRYYRADRGTGAPVFSSIAVDLTITNLLPLFVGKPVHFLPEENPVEELAEALRKRPEFSLIKITPIHLDLLGAMLEPAEMSGVAGTLVIGADFLMGEPTVVWQEHASDVRLINEYGPTETVVGCSAYELPQGRHRAGPVPVGRPIQNLRFYVLDSQMRLVAPGIGGELYIGGAGVARGYFGQPRLTAEKFLPDLFAAPGARMYRSGDRARWTADGNLLILGRTDKQVKIRGFRVELGEVEVVLRRHPAVSRCLVVVREDSPGDRRLVAYVVGHADWSDLREHLRRSLPEYMVPSAFVRLLSLPRTSTGKIDPKTLPAPDYTVIQAQSIAPRTSIEQTLAGIWADVLSLESVGVNSNFFALGGDSILAMQVVSRARRVKLHLSPRQMFEYQTIAELAAIIANWAQTPALQTETAVDGMVPLTPMQARYFEQDLQAPSYNNQSTLWLVDVSVSDAVLESALAAVFAHHDALRLRFRKTPSIWEQWHGTEHAIALEWMDLSGLSSTEQDRVQEEMANQKQASLDLEQGPLGRAVLFIRGTRMRVLLLILHHLVVDVVSWNILHQDLEQSCAQAQTGARIDLGEKSTPFRRWSEALRAYASSETLQAEIPHWQAQGADGIAPLPLDSKGEYMHQDMREVTLRFNADETRALLQDVPSTQQSQINETLLWALAESVAEWTGSTRVRLALEGHGREEIMPDIDLTHTVGWFTSIYPVVLDTSMSQSSDPGARLRSITGQLRAVPARGMGYGILRYLSEDAGVRMALSAQPEPQLIFNYIGQVDQAGHGTSFRFAQGPAGRERSGANPRANLLELNCGVVGGVLQLSWVFTDGAHRPETIQALADAHAGRLRHLIEFSRTERSDHPSTSDLPIAGLDQDELNIALNGSMDIEDLYPLSPMQEGMLFHAVSEADAQAYQVEVAYRLNGLLDIPLFRRAWARIVARHAVLRTSFLWEGLRRPLQSVHRTVDIPWHIEDWRGLSAHEHEQNLDRFLVDDRARGFDLQQPPLMRCAVLRTGNDEYWFVWSQHHLLMDGWSCSRVLSEVLRLYDAWSAGQPVDLTAARPYRDYIAWLQQQDQKAAELYWRKVLVGYIPPARLGFETAGESLTEQRANRNLWLTADLTQQLEKMARQYSVTMNTMLLGAWGLLMSRYGGQEDIVVGVTVSGRQAELDGVEDMVGMFINTLPIRVRLSGDAQFGVWLGSLQRRQAEARDYEYTPLMWVQQWSDMPRGAQLFEAHFIFENYPIGRGVRTADDTPARVQVTGTRGMEWNHYPLSLLAGPGKELLLRLSYDESRFPATTIQRMLDQLERILQQVATDPSVRLSAVTLLDVGERTLVLDTWNQTARAYPADQGIHELFAAQAARTPEALAVTYGSETLSYRELDRRANRLAHYLRELGVGPEVRVGFCLERSLELLVALLGVLKAGGAYVPLDRQYPPERLAYMLTDSAVPVLLVQERLAGLIPVPAGVQVICLDTAATQAALARQRDEAPASGVDAENLCYVIYTSGSTGRPKGVAMHHRGVCNYIAWGVEAYGAGEGNGAPVFTSMAVDLTITNLLPLFAGKPVHLLPEENPVEELAEVLRKRPDFGLIKITPTHLTLLTPLLTPEEARSATQTLVIGADFLMAEPTIFWQDHAPGVRLLNEYGPTETVVGCSAHVLSPGALRAGPVPVGGPIQNLRFYVLDGHREPVPIGLPGELYIGGVGMARGYLGRPGLTAEKFLPDPFGALGARMYRTGDRARWLESGTLLILGRIDHQIKLRGFRVELGEVEAVLRRHAGVKDCLVIARKTPANDTQMVAYVVGAALPTDLREHLRRHLPEYMLPSAFVTLETLPQTATGKLDHHALPPPQDQPSIEAYLAPHTATEEALAKIWADVLDVERVGASADFFALGGHSLRVMRLIALIRSAFGVRLHIRTVFALPTLAAMAAEIEQNIYAEIDLIPEVDAEQLVNPDQRMAG